ncbi:MAG: ferrous iron transport protein A [Megasphaera sp.]|jgi:ferrous iron transport protein A|nr:ferrous iron transport protein A [Megasphaera sp.]MCI1248424.1 ferrous iron transport protein A [Megasphaera sp.]
MTLDRSIAGHIYIIECLHLPEKTEKRLQALGMIKGTSITVLNNKNQGTLIIKMRCTRLALGKGISSRIEVRSQEI